MFVFELGQSLAVIMIPVSPVAINRFSPIDIEESKTKTNNSYSQIAPIIGSKMNKIVLTY